MAGVRVNVAGVVKQVTGLRVNVAGVVKTVLEAYVNDNGVVKKFWPDIGPPNAPANLRSTGQAATTVSLAWDAAVANGSPVTGYRIEYGTVASGAFGSFKDVGVVLADTITGLAAVTDYQFRVKANSALGYGPVSNVVEVATVAGAPATPSLSTTAATASSVTLRITKGSGDLPTQYGVSYSIAGANSWSSETNIAYTASPQTYVYDFGGQSGTPYEFRVRAKNAGGNSNYSNSAYRATSGAAPAATGTITPGDTFSGGFSDIGYSAGTAEYGGYPAVGSITGTVNGKTWEAFMQTGASSYSLVVRGTGVTATLFKRITFDTRNSSSGTLNASDATFESGLGSDASFSRWTWSVIAAGPAPDFQVGASQALILQY